MTALAPALQAFFTDRLGRQRNASPHTVAAYRDTFRLLLGFVTARTGTPASRLDISDLDTATITGFLTHLEHDRGNTARTRNARLAAIHAFFIYAAPGHPEHAGLIARVLAIPAKRHQQADITVLDAHQAEALLNAPDQATWLGRRDHALILVTLQCGLRVSELTAMCCGDVHLGTGAHVRCHGKGRKDRLTPLTPATNLGTGKLAGRAQRHAGRSPVPDRLRTPPQPRRRRQAPRQAPPAGSRTMPLTCGQGSHTPHPATHRSHEPAARRRRHHRHRLVARPRTGPDDQHLPPRRPVDQGASPRPHRAPPRSRRPLPATRPAPGIPRSPLIMPTESSTPPPATSHDTTAGEPGRHNPAVGIMQTSSSL
jgi:integrase